MISGVLLENGDGGIRTHVPVTRQPHFEFYGHDFM